MKKIHLFGAIAAFLFTVCASSHAFTFSPTTTTTALTAVNTSVSASVVSSSDIWNGTFQYTHGGITYTGFWDQGATNISKIPISVLLPGYEKTKIYAETQDWWCNADSDPKYCPGGKSPQGHIPNGEDSTHMLQATAQVEDMLSRGISGQVLDWYNTSQAGDIAAKNVMAAAENTNGAYEFGIMIDKGSVTCATSCADCANGVCVPSQAACPSGVKLATQQAACTASAQAAIDYVAKTFTQSKAYMKDASGTPVIYWYMNSYTPSYVLINWAALNPQGSHFIMYTEGFGGAKTNVTGTYGWPSPSDGAYVNKLDSMMGFSEMLGLYNQAKNYPSSYFVPSLYKGFDDNLASWSKERVIDQACGHTWLNTFKYTDKLVPGSGKYMGALDYLSAGNHVDALMIDTWDDYQEGTETETGIDNCLNSVGVSLNGTTLNWSPAFGADKLNSAITGDESTIYEYSVYMGQQGSPDVMLLDNLTCSAGVCPHTLDISTYGINGGPYVFYVQAVGQPMLKNVLSGASAPYTSVATGVTISSPANGATVSSPMKVVESCTDSQPIDHQAVWVDGVKLANVSGTSVSQSFAVSAGAHVLGIQCVQKDGTVLAKEDVDFTGK